MKLYELKKNKRTIYFDEYFVKLFIYNDDQNIIIAVRTNTTGLTALESRR